MTTNDSSTESYPWSSSIQRVDNNLMDTYLTFEEFNDHLIGTLTVEYLNDSEKHNMIINNLFDDDEGIITDTIQLKSHCTPYLNTITYNNIENYSIYFQEHSEHVNNVIKQNTKLVNLYKNEVNFNWGLHILNNLKTMIKICDIETQTKIITIVNDLEKSKNSRCMDVSNISKQIMKPEMIASYGGGNEQFVCNLSNYIVLFISFVMYHFPILVENDNIVSIFDTYIDSSTKQMGGSGENEINALENYSGKEKNEERLIYLVSVKINGNSTVKYYIKITIGIDRYRKEIKNHHYLNEYVDKLHSKKKYAPKIMKIHSPWKNNEVSSYVLKTDNKISLILDNTQYDMNIPLNIVNGITKFRETAQKMSYNEIYYMITEIDEMYTPLVKTPNMNQNNKLRAFVQIAHDLYMLNKNLGFVHWDLHKENILFKLTPDNDLCPKYFDFDLSDLCLVYDELNMIELNNQYFIATHNYKMCTSDNLTVVTDANILATEQNIRYRIKTGYLFDLIRIHTSLVYDIDEQLLDVFGNNMKQFIIRWTNEIKTNNAVVNYFNTVPEYVIRWSNDESAYNSCVSDFLTAFTLSFEYESCQIVLLCAYNLMFSQKYNHANKKLFFEEILHQFESTNLTPENRKYMIDELTILRDILKNKQYTEDYLNKLNTIHAFTARKCNISPSFIEYQSFIYYNVKTQIEQRQKKNPVQQETNYKNTKKDYQSMTHLSSF